MPVKSGPGILMKKTVVEFLHLVDMQWNLSLEVINHSILKMRKPRHGEIKLFATDIQLLTHKVELETEFCLTLKPRFPSLV